MVSIGPQGNNLQTTCLGTRALKDSPEPCRGSSDSERRWWRHIPRSWQLVPVASVPPPSPGAQGDVFAEGEADNRGKWAVPRTPMVVAHGPGCCCPWQAEASGLSQPRLHVAGTLLFVLVPQEGSSAPLGTRGQNCRHLTAQPHAWGEQGLSPWVTGTGAGPGQTRVSEGHGTGTRAARECPRQETPARGTCGKPGCRSQARLKSPTGAGTTPLRRRSLISPDPSPGKPWPSASQCSRNRSMTGRLSAAQLNALSFSVSLV